MTLDDNRSSIANLTSRLECAIRASLQPTVDAEQAFERAQSSYQKIARVIVEVRHQFRGPHGETHDLRGQSAGYRQVVRDAYRRAGVRADGPLAKRITAGVAYWVRKELVERYGEDRLRQLGVLPVAERPTPSQPGAMVDRVLRGVPVEQQALEVVGLLNWLATTPSVPCSEELVEAATRAIIRLRERVRGMASVA